MSYGCVHPARRCAPAAARRHRRPAPSTAPGTRSRPRTRHVRYRTAPRRPCPSPARRRCCGFAVVRAGRRSSARRSTAAAPGGRLQQEPDVAEHGIVAQHRMRRWTRSKTPTTSSAPDQTGGHPPAQHGARPPRRAPTAPPRPCARDHASVPRRKAAAEIGGSRRSQARRRSGPRTGRTRPDRQRRLRAAGPSRSVANFRCRHERRSASISGRAPARCRRGRARHGRPRRLVGRPSRGSRSARAAGSR